ncbi:hypothetical protein CDAR_545141 [Caerostris darwini]|uniref:Uncharacterized protein n=2 Tax=Caerostris TaxID=172845 RepID=A0AAV4TGY6_9ARAC|nr:hypothetical protein CDAR_545141 [Caerostris darwini]GIY97348.1 hypothetical protein CEXT_262011 [Caerostris extrusa]
MSGMQIRTQFIFGTDRSQRIQSMNGIPHISIPPIKYSLPLEAVENFGECLCSTLIHYASLELVFSGRVVKDHKLPDTSDELLCFKQPRTCE